MVAKPKIEQDRVVAPFETISLKKLLEGDWGQLQWIVPGILPEGLTLFFADAKLGKSMVALALMLRMIRHLIADGSVQGDVLYISKDDRSKRRLKSRIGSLLDGYRIGDREGMAAHFTFGCEAVNTGLITQLDMWMSGHPNTKLVVVDVYAAIRPRSGTGDAFGDSYDALDPLRDWAEKRHIAILLLHHTNKRSQNNTGDWTKDVNGPTGLLGACDTLWKLEGESYSNAKTLKAKGRDVEETWLRVDLDDLTQEWQEQGIDESISVSESRIMKLFETETLETLSPKIVGIHLPDMNPRTIRTCLRRLTAKGLLRNDDYGAYERQSVSTVSTVSRTANDAHFETLTEHNDIAVPLPSPSPIPLFGQQVWPRPHDTCSCGACMWGNERGVPICRRCKQVWRAQT